MTINLHIIGGSLRSRSLKSPKGDKTRPTTALVRKAVFDMVQPYIKGAYFLDLFAGSGAMGIEALSRGAIYTIFIDQNAQAIRCINDNLSSLELEKSATVIQGDVMGVLKKLKRHFDIIYCDPPYGKAELHLTILPFLDQSDLIKKGSFVFLEESYHSKLQLEGVSLNRLKRKDSRHFGKSLLHRYVLT